MQLFGGYDEIIEQIEKGKTFEEFIPSNSKSLFYRSLHFFMRVSSIEQAILEAQEYENMKKTVRQEWLKETSYPILVFFLALIVFVFFDFFIYPQLQSMVPYSTAFEFHRLLSFTLRTVFMLFLSFLFSSFILYLLMRKNEDVRKGLLQKISKIKIMKKILSYDYALHTLILSKRGYSTLNIFESLRHLNTSLFLKMIIEEMITHLENGEEMMQIIENCPYLDNRFKQFYKIAACTQTFDKTLEDYCQFQRDELKKTVQNSSKVVSLIAYLMISLLVVSIYQMLLTPLEQLTQF